MSELVLYTLVLSHPTVSGRFTTEARSERGAIKNVVFRELGRRNRSSTDIRPKALALASLIYERQLYKVEDARPLLPPGVSYPEFEKRDVPDVVDAEFDEPADRPRRGDQEYPENPDEVPDAD